MSKKTIQEIHDAKECEVGTIRYDYSPVRPWALYEGFLGIGLGAWLIGGIVLEIPFQIISKVVSLYDFAPSSLGFNVAGLAGLSLAA